ncbi:hypothetical protein ACHAQJ_005944 [Trichoderma viride]
MPAKRRGFKLQLSLIDSSPSRLPERPLGISGERRFVYKPLTDSQCVRFLILEPGSGSDPLVGSLDVGSFNLAEIEQLPPYKAVSNTSQELQSLTVDYSKSVKDIYIDVAVRALRGAKDLFILSSQHAKPFAKQQAPWACEDLGLPSWVPDWRYLGLHTLGRPTAPHRASKNTKPDLIIDEDARIMYIRGVMVDTVKKQSNPFNKTAFQMRHDARGPDQAKDCGPTQPQAGRRTPNSGNGRVDNTQQSRTPFQGLKSESDHHLHVTETLWRLICGYRTFTLNHVYRPFLEKSPAAAAAKSLSSSSTSSQDHRRSAFFAFIQTLTNGCTGIDRLRPYSSISSEEWLTSAAAYLVRYAFPSIPSASSSSSSSSSATPSPSRVFPSLPSKSLANANGRGNGNGNGNGSVMSKFYERANSLSSRQTPTSNVIHTPISDDIHALSQDGDPFKWRHEAVIVTRFRCFAITRNGYFLLGPDSMQMGDVVAVLRGGKVPFLLRKVSVGIDNERWVLIRECYVHGLMDGEGWDVEGVEEKVFAIQ